MDETTPGDYENFDFKNLSFASNNPEGLWIQKEPGEYGKLN